MRPALVLNSPKRSTPASTANCTNSCARRPVSSACRLLTTMDSSLFKLTSLNLNGIRSAASKGVEAWIAKTQPDCICLQEVKAQAPDVEGRFEEIAGLKGHFHFAQKKGYSGVGVYSRHAPSDVIVGFGSEEFDAEGRWVELRFDTPARKFSVISCYFPSGSPREELQLPYVRVPVRLQSDL